MENNKHISVLLNEAIESLDIKKDGIYLDLTLGRGGHTKAILDRLENGKVIAFDKDSEAIEYVKSTLSNYNNLILIHDDFRNLKANLSKMNIVGVDGILMDLGVSSPQFDNPSRGFSYRNDAHIDMRMDTSKNFSAFDIVNTYSIEELTKIFREYGEEKYAYQIAKKIINNRPVNTTFELVDIIKSAKPSKELNKKGHPAKQVFQALRIETNDELSSLQIALDDGIEILKNNGRFVVISFHSLEDRIVKNTFMKLTKIEGDRHNVFSLPNVDDFPKYELVNKKIILPSEEEMVDNPRSKSAKMRVLRKK